MSVSYKTPLSIEVINNGVHTTLIHYPTPPHKQPAYKEWNDRTYTITEEIHNTIISIPISLVLTKEEIELVVGALNDFI